MCDKGIQGLGSVQSNGFHLDLTAWYLQVPLELMDCEICSHLFTLPVLHALFLLKWKKEFDMINRTGYNVKAIYFVNNCVWPCFLPKIAQIFRSKSLIFFMKARKLKDLTLISEWKHDTCVHASRIRSLPLMSYDADALNYSWAVTPLT